MSRNSTLLGVVLCGGQSTRMGQDKAALPCPDLGGIGNHGNTFFDVAVRRLQQHCQHVAISGHCSVSHSMVMIQDNVAHKGPMQGIIASLEYAKSNDFDACLFTPIDVPFLTDRDLSWLIKTWVRKPALTVAVSDRIEPLIAIYPTTLIDELRNCFAKDQLSLMKWIKDAPLQSVAISKSSCRNINRPTDMKTNKFAFNHPDDALRALADRLTIQPIVSSASDFIGRVLAETVIADRDSPAADVSAMDGYAIRMSDIDIDGAIQVDGESACGKPPPSMPDQGVVRIFTGAIVPEDCDAVIKREDTIESNDSIELSQEAKAISCGANIRRCGENLPAGDTVFDAGVLISAVAQAALVNFGHCSPSVFGPVKVSVLTTGDEVIEPHESPKPWQLRNSNMMSLIAMLGGRPWIQMQSAQHCGDDRAKLKSALQQSLADSDAVVLTGGVSMGDYDFVPDVVGEVGGEIVFHRLPIRPGQPILGAVTGDGKLIIGLPGNPVSAIVNTRRMVMPLLAKMSGQTNWLPPQPKIQVEGLRNKLLPLHQMVLVKINDAGHGEVVASKGSGDLVALAHSDGFVQIPPNTAETEPRPFFHW